MKKIAVYGGAFNPPTNGHKYVIENIFNETNIDKIILNPDGDRIDKDYKIEKKYRKKMIDLFVYDLKTSGLNVEINDYFLEGKNSRDTTIMQVKDYYNEILGFEPTFIFGTDVINNMPKWKDNVNCYIEKVLKKIFIKRGEEKYDLELFENYTIIDNKILDISSSMVKEYLKETKENVSKLIIPEIKNYILENNLYV